MNDPANLTDEELLRALSSGDDIALAALAGRHARGVHDFALRSTMDGAQAAEITDSAFQRLRGTVNLPPQIDFRTWLYSLALVEVLGLANERRLSRMSVEDRRFIQTNLAFDSEVLLWAWQAARGLRTRDYCVLDLTLRRGLTPEELADSASLTRNNLYASIGRARGAFEETFGASVLYMRGRAFCPDLEALVSSTSGGSVRPALRHQIADHADACEACRKTLSSLPLAAEVFVALLDVELPPELPSRLLGAGVAAGPAAQPSPGGAETVAAGAALLADSEAAPVADAEEADQGAGLFDMPSRARTPVSEAEARPYYDEPEPATPRYGYQETFSDRIARWVDLARGQPLIWSWVLGGVATVLAIYIALAVGDSLQGGNGSSGAVPLETVAGAAAPGRVIDCPAPISLNQGTSSVVSFDSKSLDGYQLGGLAVEPKSQGATAAGLEATMSDAYSISFVAPETQSAVARTDQYELRISWRKGDEVATSACEVTVRVPPPSP